MAATYERYTANGVLTTFNVPFPYIEREDVKVYVNGVLQVEGASYTFSSPSAIQFLTPPTSGATITIRRISEQNTRIVDFVNGAVLTESDLDLSATQLFYMIQENRDLLESIINGTFQQVGNSLIEQIAAEILSSATAAEIQSRISDIDAAGQLLLDEMMARRVIGEPTDDYTAFILDQDHVMVSPTESLAQRFETLAASGADAAALVLTEQTARVAADEALAEDISAVIASVGTNTAAIATEASARATGDSANASLISALTATVDDQAATITTLASATAALEDGVADLEARYGVSLNVNGYITGFTQFNDGDSGTFAILADQFYIVDPASGGQNPTTVFGISGGVVALQNALVAGSLIVNGSITTSKIAAGQITASLINVSTLSAISANVGHLTGGTFSFTAGTNQVTFDGTNVTIAGKVILPGAFSTPGSVAGDLTGHDIGRHTEASPSTSTGTGSYVTLSSFKLRGSGTVAIRVRYNVDTVSSTGSGDRLLPMTQPIGLRVLVNGSVAATQGIEANADGSGTFTFYSVSVSDPAHTIEIQGRHGFGSSEFGGGTYVMSITSTGYDVYAINSYIDNL